jgi:hypothetical protein
VHASLPPVATSSRNGRRGNRLLLCNDGNESSELQTAMSAPAFSVTDSTVCSLLSGNKRTLDSYDASASEHTIPPTERARAVKPWELTTLAEFQLCDCVEAWYTYQLGNKTPAAVMKEEDRKAIVMVMSHVKQVAAAHGAEGTQHIDVLRAGKKDVRSSSYIEWKSNWDAAVSALCDWTFLDLREKEFNTFPNYFALAKPMGDQDLNDVSNYKYRKAACSTTLVIRKRYKTLLVGSTFYNAALKKYKLKHDGQQENIRIEIARRLEKENSRL